MIVNLCKFTYNIKKTLQMIEYEEWNSLLNYNYDTNSPIDKNSFLFQILRAGCTLCNKDFLINRQEQYPYYAIHILLDGYGLLQIQNKNYFLKKGDAFLIMPGQAHTYSNYASSNLILLWVEITGGNCKELFSYFQSRKMYAIQNESTDKAARQILKILQHLRAYENNQIFECSGMVYSFLMYIHESARNILSKKLPDLLEQALSYIDDNFTETIKIQELADNMHISHTYLNRIFAKGIGMSPKRYILMKRIEYACYLLETTELTSEEISSCIGMYDNACFYRNFKSVMQTTPVAYRESRKSTK